jgi:hypothetical protein
LTKTSAKYVDPFMEECGTLNILALKSTVTNALTPTALAATILAKKMRKKFVYSVQMVINQQKIVQSV